MDTRNRACDSTSHFSIGCNEADERSYVEWSKYCMKIAITLFFRAPLGGLQDNIHATAVNLMKNGHEVMVFCPPGPFQEILKRDAIPVMDLIRGAADGLSFDLVHAHPGESRVFGQRLAQQLDIPLFVTFHGSWIDDVISYHGECTRILAVSGAVRDKVVSAAPEAADKVEIIPNAVDLTRVTAGASSSRPAEGEYMRVLVASRFDVDKKRLITSLISLWEEQAARSIRNIFWELAGDGTLLDDMREACQRIFGEGAPVRFYGWLDKPALSQLFETADVALAPGRSALEAMAWEKPVVPVGSAGCFGLLTETSFDSAAYCNFGGFGLVSEPTSETVITDLAALAANPVRRAELGHLSRRYIETHFDLANHHYSLERLYRIAIEAHRR